MFDQRRNLLVKVRIHLPDDDHGHIETLIFSELAHERVADPLGKTRTLKGDANFLLGAYAAQIFLLHLFQAVQITVLPDEPIHLIVSFDLHAFAPMHV